MSNKKSQAFRGLRKTANISNRAFSKAARLSGKIENKADRIINGTDPTVQIHDKVLFEKIYAEAIPEITPIHPALPRAGREATVTLFIPSLQKSSFFGGTATALIFAGKIAADKGLPIRIAETLQHGNAKVDELAEFINKNGIKLGSDSDIELINLSPRTYNKYGYLDIHPDDIFVASAWWDAYLLDQLPLLKPYVYLIQDYEPIFYNNSDKYVLSESTYHSDRFIPVCNTELMYKFMVSKGYENIKQTGVWFEPAVGLQNTKSKSVISTGKKRMFIYGRPSVARNLYHFTLSCLDDLFLTQQLIGSEWEIFMAGQDKLADVILGSGIVLKNLGKMPINEYHEFVQSIDLAISPMMAPHPNYPTLEFASAGASVVTTKYETKKDLRAYSSNIVISDISKPAFSDAILKGASLDKSTRQKNLKTNNISSDWSTALDDTVAKVLKKL